MQDVQLLSATELKNKLIEVTIGGARASVNLEQKKILFAEYMQRAFPEIRILDLMPTDTSAALNSVSATADVELNGQRLGIFGKVHIESETRVINAVGVEEEYQKASLLVEAGWPVVKPIAMSQQSDYPLLLYPKMDEPTLFDELEKSNMSGVSTLTKQQLLDLSVYNSAIGQKEVKSLRPGLPDEAKNAPVQTLFLKRLEEGGRIDQWYAENTIFQLPGLAEPISWKELLISQWKINGDTYKTTLKDIIDKARQLLAFEGEENAFLTLSHGDDHSGNVRLTQPPLVFDPAFAGWNPASLDLKALAHTGFLPLAGMYYLPKGLNCTYQKSGDEIQVVINLTSLPMYKTFDLLAKQIIDTRVIPLLKKVKQLGGDIDKESQRIKYGLAECALLTVNIAKLLDQRDGRAIGLLPMAILFSELNGLSALDYLNTEIKKL